MALFIAPTTDWSSGISRKPASPSGRTMCAMVVQTNIAIPPRIPASKTRVLIMRADCQLLERIASLTSRSTADPPSSGCAGLWREGDDQVSEDRGQRTEDRGQRTEDRGQRTGGRGQRSEGRGQRS